MNQINAAVDWTRIDPIESFAQLGAPIAPADDFLSSNVGYAKITS
jgi:hypothetical protein